MSIISGLLMSALAESILTSPFRSIRPRRRQYSMWLTCLSRQQCVGQRRSQRMASRFHHEHPNSALRPEPYAGQGYPSPLVEEYALQYQARDKYGKPEYAWRICYAFTLTELHSSDYEALHYAICRQPGLLTGNVLMALHVAPAKEEESMTRLTLFNDRMLEHRHGGEPVKTVFANEAER